MMDRMLPLRQDSGNGNRGQCPEEPPRGSRRSTGLTSVIDPFCNSHPWANKVGGRASPRRRPLLRRQPWIDSTRKACESGGQETRIPSSWEHRVRKEARPRVRHCEDGSSNLHTQKRPQDAPSAKTDSKNQNGRQLGPVQHGSNTVTGSMEDAYRSFKQHHNRCMKKARAAEARLRVLTRMHDIVPERAGAVQIACVQAVALYGSEVWWDPKEISRREDLELLLNRRVRSTWGALPKKPLGPLMRDSGLTPMAVTLDCRQ